MTNIQYTRYLYNWVQVKQSLLISLLNNNICESLFWTCELYLSGFQEDTIYYIRQIYLNIYKKLHPELDIYFTKECSNEDERLLILCSIIATLSTRTYDLSDFCKDYFNINGIQENNKKKRFFVRVKSNDIQEYIIQPTCVNRKILEIQCKYKIRNEYDTLFKTNTPSYDELYKYFNNNWLYFAYDTPIWQNRINTYKGIKNDDSLEIIFDNDDNLELFHEKWGYDTDEQKTTTKEQCIGSKCSTQYNIKDFCKQFGLKINIMPRPRFPKQNRPPIFTPPPEFIVQKCKTEQNNPR